MSSHYVANRHHEPTPWAVRDEPTPWAVRDEPTPWVVGLCVAATLAIFAASVLIGIYELVESYSPLAGVGVVAIVAVGFGTTLWDFRVQSVWRWITWGTMAGLSAGFATAVVLALASR